MRAQGFDVGDEMLRRVVLKRAEWTRASRAALVEQHDALEIGIEQAAIVGRAAAARPAVQEERRLAIGICRRLSQ